MGKLDKFKTLVFPISATNCKLISKFLDKKFCDRENIDSHPSGCYLNTIILGSNFPRHLHKSLYLRICQVSAAAVQLAIEP